MNPLVPNEADRDGSVLTDPVLIGIMLEKTRNNRSLLSITLPGIQEEFLSVITAIDDKTGHFFIDELKPAHGNDKLKQLKQFIASARLQGVSISFKGELQKIVRKGALTTYCARLPTRLQYHERRCSHRVPVAIGLNLSARVYDNGKQPLTMRIADISAEGVGLVAGADDCRQLIESKNMLRCGIHFPEETDEWLVRIRPCMENRLPGKGRTRIFGAVFLDLTIKQRNILTRQLRFFDRENIRKTQRD